MLQNIHLMVAKVMYGVKMRPYCNRSLGDVEAVLREMQIP